MFSVRCLQHLKIKCTPKGSRLENSLHAATTRESLLQGRFIATTMESMILLLRTMEKQRQFLKAAAW